MSLIAFGRKKIAALAAGLISPYWKWKVRSWVAKGCRKGENVFLHPTVQMLGAANVAIGNNTCIGEQTWISVNSRIEGEIGLVIGDNCFIGRRNFFTSGKCIEIGHYVLTGPECKFIGSTHVADDPFVPYITTGVTLDKVIRVGANCFFGAGATVLGNVNIGHGSVIGAGALVIKDVPPFSIVVGNPARVLRRYSILKQEWVSAESVTEEDLQGLPAEEAYLDMLRDGYSALSMPIIAAGADIGDM